MIAAWKACQHVHLLCMKAKNKSYHARDAVAYWLNTICECKWHDICTTTYPDQLCYREAAVSTSQIADQECIIIRNVRGYSSCRNGQDNESSDHAVRTFRDVTQMKAIKGVPSLPFEARAIYHQVVYRHDCDEYVGSCWSSETGDTKRLTSLSTKAVRVVSGESLTSKAFSAVANRTNSQLTISG